MPWLCWFDHVFYRGLMSLPMGFLNLQGIGITYSLLWAINSIVDSMCLFITDLKGLSSVTSSYTVCIWRLTLIGGKDWCIDVGKISGCRVRQICVGIPLSHFLAFELSHCHGCSGTSSWPHMNIHYLFLADGYYDYDASLSNIVSSWPGTLALLKKGHLISWFVFDKWPAEVVLFKCVGMEGKITHYFS